MRSFAGLGIFCAVLAGCGGGEQATVRAGAVSPSASGPAGTSSGPPAVAPSLPADWVDPEPADAQARAEAVVAAEFNRNKTTALAMRILPIVDRTSRIEGVASQLAAAEQKIDDTLSRLGARVSETEVTIQLPGSILFDFDSARIRADAERTLGDVARVIAAYAGRPVRVEGHTDSIASDAYNQKLSEARAGSVADWLLAQGIERDRIRSAGFGESRPVASNDTPAGRQQNRRVEIVIETGA